LETGQPAAGLFFSQESARGRTGAFGAQNSGMRLLQVFSRPRFPRCRQRFQNPGRRRGQYGLRGRFSGTGSRAQATLGKGAARGCANGYGSAGSTRCAPAHKKTGAVFPRRKHAL